MRTTGSKRYGASSWLIGALVLIALSLAVTWMLNKGDRVGASLRDGKGQQDHVVAPELPRLMKDVSTAQRADDVIVRGLVLTPSGGPAVSATVTLYRLITGWPEWRRERVDEAITHEEGAFQFRCPHYHGFLVRYEHSQYAGGFEEVPLLGNSMRLQLQPGFAISGFVINDVGAPVPNARVSVESVLGERRRASHALTAADGSYNFQNLAAGPARLMARHESWQPVRASALVIGDREQADLRFDRPSMSPLRGRVLSVATQEPIAGATVQLLPLSDSLGLSDPMETTTGEDGAFILSGLPRGSMSLVVSHEGYGTRRVTQSVGMAGGEVTLDLPNRTRVTGMLDADNGDVFAGGEVLMIRDAGNAEAYAKVQADGSFEFDRALSPGAATVNVLGNSFAFRSRNGGVWGKVLAESPENELEIGVVEAAVLRGRLVDPEGRPVADALLTRSHLLSDTVAVLSAAAWQLDLSRVSDGLVQLVDVARDGPLAVSAADGTFEINGYRRGTLVARVDRPGFGRRFLSMEVPSPGVIEDVGDTQLSVGCSIAGRVLRGGQPFVGATVTVISASCQSMVTTDAAGRFLAQDLEPGQYEVKGRLADRPTGKNVQVVTVGADRPARDVEISLDIGRVVRGVVQDEAGAPLEGALISIRGKPSQVISTKQNGRFEMELPARGVELVVSFGDRANQKIVPIAAEAEELMIELQPPASATLIARVAGLPGRKAVPGVLLRLVELENTADVDLQARYIDTLNGTFRKEHVPTGSVRIEIWCDGYAPFQVVRVLKPNEEYDLGDVLLSPGASLRGVVQDADGNAVQGAMVLLGQETDFDLFVPSVRSDHDGAFTIQGVTSASKQLIVRSPGFAASSVTLQLPRDVLSADPLVIKLERGATIEVLVTGDNLPEDRIVYLRRGAALLHSTVLDDLGRAWFANRSAGKYSVMLLGSALPEQVVDVKRDDDLLRVRFDMRR